MLVWKIYIYISLSGYTHEGIMMRCGSLALTLSALTLPLSHGAREDLL